MWIYTIDILQTTPRMFLKSHLIVYNWPMQRRLNVWHSPSTKSHVFNLPQLIKVYLTISDLTLCMLSNFSCILLSADFFNISFFEKFFQEHHQSVKLFESRSGPTFCQSWSGSKLFLQRLSADDKSLFMPLNPISTSGPEVIKNFMLNSAENEIYPAHTIVGI